MRENKSTSVHGVWPTAIPWRLFFGWPSCAQDAETPHVIRQIADPLRFGMQPHESCSRVCTSYIYRRTCCIWPFQHRPKARLNSVLAHAFSDPMSSLAFPASLLEQHRLHRLPSSWLGLPRRCGWVPSSIRVCRSTTAPAFVPLCDGRSTPLHG